MLVPSWAKFLVVIDAHSKWIDVEIVNSTSAVSTIIKLRSLFATHGIPEQLVSDNGSGFRSEEFKQFTTQNGIKHIFTSPYNPSSNGLAERAVQTSIVQLLKWMVELMYVYLDFYFSIG